MIKGFTNLKSRNKYIDNYYWFIVITIIFLLDNGISALYYLIPYENAEDVAAYNLRVIVYTMCVSFVNSFIYLYIAFFKPRVEIKCLDTCYAALCALLTIYSSMRPLYDAIYMSDAWFWLIYIIIGGILFWNKNV